MLLLVAGKDYNEISAERKEMEIEKGIDFYLQLAYTNCK